MPEQMTSIAILKRFFHNPSQPISFFLLEVKALGREERMELARLAAIELGVEVEVKEG